MGWFWRDKRGPEWKQGWTSQTITSSSLPPLPLLAIFAIVLLFLFISQYTGYKAQMEQTMFSFQIILFIVPVLLIFVVRSLAINGKNFVFRFPRIRGPAQQHQHDDSAHHQAGGGGGGGSSSSPWGVAALLMLLILMISYKSSFDSQWFRPMWRRSD